MQWTLGDVDAGLQTVTDLGNGHTFLDQRAEIDSYWAQSAPMPGEQSYEGLLRERLGETLVGLHLALLVAVLEVDARLSCSCALLLLCRIFLRLFGSILRCLCLRSGLSGRCCLLAAAAACHCKRHGCRKG